MVYTLGKLGVNGCSPKGVHRGREPARPVAFAPFGGRALGFALAAELTEKEIPTNPEASDALGFFCEVWGSMGAMSGAGSDRRRRGPTRAWLVLPGPTEGSAAAVVVGPKCRFAPDLRGTTA